MAFRSQLEFQLVALSKPVLRAQGVFFRVQSGRRSVAFWGLLMTKSRHHRSLTPLFGTVAEKSMPNGNVEAGTALILPQ
jgi:hypothetical protein